MLDPFSYSDWVKRHLFHRGEMIASWERERP
jgi:hypothetical protein